MVNTNQKIIFQGAEAIISLDKTNNQITKHRIKKSYRIKEIDEKLRFRRTKAEAKIINKLQNIINVPKIIKVDKENIIMEFIEGKKLSDYLEELDYKEICKKLGQILTKLHNENIIHGDLTTSNMIYVEDSKKINDVPTNSSNIINLNNNINNKISSHERARGEHFKLSDNILNKNLKCEIAHEKSSNKEDSKIYLIDFGLGFHSQKIEDKAVDLHLLKQALDAKHYKIADECFKIIIENYNPEKKSEILQRITAIEKRGRYRH